MFYRQPGALVTLMATSHQDNIQQIRREQQRYKQYRPALAPFRSRILPCEVLEALNLEISQQLRDHILKKLTESGRGSP